MNRTLQFVIFLTVFLSLYGLMHFYVFWRLFTLFSFKRGVVFYSALVAGTLSYLAATMLEHRFSNLPSRIIYIAASIWMGALFIFLALFLVYEILHHFLPMTNRTWGKLLLGIGALLILYSLVNASFIRLKTYNISSAKITAPVKIVLLSDIHFGPIRKKKFLESIVEKTNRLNPDIVVITGDLLDGPYPYKEEDFAPLKNFSAPVYFITGNHERYAGPDKVETFLNPLGFHFLRNSSVEWKEMDIIGIDDAEDKRRVEEILADMAVDSSRFSVLLYHRPIPSLLETVSRNNIDLLLCGHVHAGQIVPFNFIVGLFYRPERGIHHKNGAYQIVSMGAGTWGPPMRLGTRSEIIIVCIDPVPDPLSGKNRKM